MNGLTQMLYSPQMEKILAELEDYQGTTLGDLLGLHAGLQPPVRPGQLVPPAADLLEALSDAGRAGQMVVSLGNAAGDASAVATNTVKAVKKDGNAGIGAVEKAATRPSMG